VVSPRPGPRLAAAAARVYPARPSEGVRATKPNQLWHIDVTLIRLLDGTRAYLHAVIDNFSGPPCPAVDRLSNTASDRPRVLLDAIHCPVGRRRDATFSPGRGICALQ
jgi:hypothetical protein